MTASLLHHYPPVGFHFLVTFSISPNTLDVGFQSVSGLSVECEVETHKEGGENGFEHKLPGRIKYTDVVLKRGLVVQGSLLYTWCLAAFRDRNFIPANVLISLMNDQHQPLKTWSLFGAWPRKWSLSDFNAQESTIMIETLDLTYKYFEVIPPI